MFNLIKCFWSLYKGLGNSGAYDLTAINATQHAMIEKKWQDNLVKKTPLMLQLRDKEGYHLVDGGKELTFPVIIGDGIAASYYGDDVLDTSKPTGLNALTFAWKQFYSTVRIDGLEEVMNGPEGQGPDLLEGRMTQSETTTINNFEKMLCGDSTGNTGADGLTRDWNGLQGIVSDTPTTGTIGGLSRASFAQLQNQVYSTAITAFNTALAGRTGFTTLYASCVQGTRVPNFCLTTPAIWALFDLSLQSNERVLYEGSDVKKMVQAGFPTLGWMGMPITMSAYCVANHAYFLRLGKPKTDGGLFLVISKQKNFKLGRFIEPVNQDILVAKVTTAGQFATDAPYLHGVVTNITG